MRGWEGLHQEKSKISVVKFNLFNLAKAGVIMGRVLYRIADYTCIIFVIGAIVGAIVGAIWGLYKLTMGSGIEVVIGIWVSLVIVGLWGFIEWYGRYKAKIDKDRKEGVLLQR